MLLYCLKCRENTGGKNPKFVKSKKERIMFLSNCALCDSKRSRFIKEQEGSGLWISLVINTLLSTIALVGSLLLQEY